MFKKLRNNLLLTNMIIISALVIGCLTAIYITTYSFVKQDVNKRLDGAIRMSTVINRLPREFEERKPPARAENGAVRHDRPEPREGEDVFNVDIAVYCDKSGNVISTHSAFTPEGFDFSDKLKEIISLNKEEGSTTLDVDSWAYKRIEYGEGYIVSFTKNEAEQNMLFALMIILVVAGIASIGVSYLVSRFSANCSIRPIEDAYNKQKQFIADASHELRTPLASINANADVLLSKTESTIGDEQKWLVYIKDETERLTALTNDLLTLAKADSEDNKQILTSVSFSDVVEDVVLEMEANAFEQGVMICSDIKENINVAAVQSGLKQIALILIDNAVKFSQSGDSVEVLLKSENGKAVFEVKNKGSINREDLPHIFERFYRADKSRASKGYGLGLAIAKSLCKSFGGSIEAKSLDNMTIFKVILNEI